MFQYFKSNSGHVLMRNGRRSNVKLLFLFIILISISQILILSFISYETIDRNNVSHKTFPLFSKDFPWPPLKIYVYPNNSRHSSDCLYPPELPLRYVNETGYWFQRMLEPTVHHQFLESPLLTQNQDEADLFFIPHYSRMCSGLDNGVRWNEIPSWMNTTAKYFKRYSDVDHFIMHSVPNYGDKPADSAVFNSRAPMIGLLDFKWEVLKRKPWTFAKSIVLPFITLTDENLRKKPKENRRDIDLFVAMSTKQLAKKSAELRRELKAIMENMTNTEFVEIKRNSPKTFTHALKILPEKMSSSELCVIPPGDAPSSKRLYDAISHLCVPLLVSDKITLPYDGVDIDYNDVFLQIPSKNISTLPSFVSNLTKTELGRIRKTLKRVKEMFTWDYKNPPKPGQALWSLSWALYDRIMMLKPYRNNEMTGYDDDPDVDYNFKFYF